MEKLFSFDEVHKMAKAAKILVGIIEVEKQYNEHYLIRLEEEAHERGLTQNEMEDIQVTGKAMFMLLENAIKKLTQ